LRIGGAAKPNKPDDAAKRGISKWMVHLYSPAILFQVMKKSHKAPYHTAHYSRKESREKKDEVCARTNVHRNCAKLKLPAYKDRFFSGAPNIWGAH
jgi:hypothetical protein